MVAIEEKENHQSLEGRTTRQKQGHLKVYVHFTECFPKDQIEAV